MSKAALSMFVFGIYVILLGIILMVVPNALLAIFGLPATTEVWVRVVGMLVFLIGYYYIRASRNEKEMISFYRWTVHARSSVIIFLIIFVAFDNEKKLSTWINCCAIDILPGSFF